MQAHKSTNLNILSNYFSKTSYLEHGATGLLHVCILRQPPYVSSSQDDDVHQVSAIFVLNGTRVLW